MGELQEIKRLLETTLSSISQNMAMQQQMILQLQKENQKLKQLMKEKDPLKKEIITTYKRNKKRLIKNKILETIKLKQLSIPEIKDIVVDQYNYCSKATFYRYIEELKRKDYIQITNNTARIKPLVEVV
ncbi:MAG: hypothetical protein ACMXYG_01510 [Candidatus Woesearchaeota archaeon]